MTATIKPVFLVERTDQRSGKVTKFALYGGLVDAAHSDEIGLAGITTELIQIATEDNGRQWIFRAYVTTKKGVFTGYGDADPSNVSRAMLTSAMRLAETRAKARALRDAVNAGALVAYEELDDTSTDETGQPFGDEVPEVKLAPRPVAMAQGTAATDQRAGAPTAPPRPVNGGSVDGVTGAQLRAIFSIGKDRQLTDDAIEERSTALFSTTPSHLSKRQASEFITALKAGK